jgi:NAD(P)-dependent dehydrogenase (short-subunit alcohol dehydrogenase family)
MTDIAGKIAIVTGGASGIGRGIAEALIEEGATVVIADIEQGALDTTAAEIGATGVLVDVAKMESVEALRDTVLERFGRVDIVCLNAGVGPLARIAELTLKDWEWMLGVNLWGVIHGITAFLPVLKANADGGHIEVTGSVASFNSNAGLGSYAATKMAVRAIVDALAIELEQEGSNVHVTLLAPGTVSTNIGTSSRNRPSALAGALADVDISEDFAKDMRFIRPITAGRITVRSIKNNDRYSQTHPDWWPMVEASQKLVEESFRKYPVMEDEGPQAGEQGAKS